MRWLKVSRTEQGLYYANSAKIQENIAYYRYGKELKNIYDYSRVNNMNYIIIYNNKETGNSAINEMQLANLDRLDNIALLKDDWNGYDGKKINETSIAVSRNIIRNILKQPVLYPTGRDSIQLQFELKDKSYLEFEVFENRITCMQVPKRIYANAVFQTLEITDIQAISRIIEVFYGDECTEG